MVTRVVPMTAGPLSHFFVCEVNSLVRSNSLWKTSIVDNVLSKFTDDSFDTLQVGKVNL